MQGQKPSSSKGNENDVRASSGGGPEKADTSGEATADYKNDPLSEDPGDEAAEVRRVLVSESLHGVRLDKLLVEVAPEFSRSYLQQLIRNGRVRVGEHLAAVPSRRVAVGQQVAVELVPTAESRAFKPEPMTLRIVFEDEHVIVVDKPAGCVVHPAAGNWSGTLLNGLLAHHPAASALPRAGIVHRLDKDTSGLMVVGKTLPAVTALVRALAARTLTRRYRAIAWGDVGAERFSVDAPIGRDPASRVRMAVVAGGKPARTDFEPVAMRSGFSALHCALHTGRTHQIRVHLASRSHPLVADALYGGAPALGLMRQALHAARLAFAHPMGGRRLDFGCEPPADFATAWDLLIA